MTDLLTQSLVVGAFAYVAKAYYDQHYATHTDLNLSGRKTDMMMQPMETAQMVRTTAEQEWQTGLTSENIASKTGGDHTDWQTVQNIMIDQNAPSSGQYDPLEYTWQAQPLFYGDRRNFYDPVQHRT